MQLDAVAERGQNVRMTNRDGYVLHGLAFLGAYNGWADKIIIQDYHNSKLT